MSAKQEILRIFMSPGSFSGFVDECAGVEVNRGREHRLFWSNDLPVYKLVAETEGENWLYIEAGEILKLPEEFLRFVVKVEYSLMLLEDESFSNFSVGDRLEYSREENEKGSLSLENTAEGRIVLISADSLRVFEFLWGVLVNYIGVN